MYDDKENAGGFITRYLSLIVMLVDDNYLHHGTSWQRSNL